MTLRLNEAASTAGADTLQDARAPFQALSLSRAEVVLASVGDLLCVWASGVCLECLCVWA